jgi:hypothetical protein
MKKKLDVTAQLSPKRRVMADELQWIVQDLSGDQWKNIWILPLSGHDIRTFRDRRDRRGRN